MLWTMIEAGAIVFVTMFVGCLVLAVLAAMLSDDPASATGVMEEGQVW